MIKIIGLVIVTIIVSAILPVSIPAWGIVLYVMITREA